MFIALALFLTSPAFAENKDTVQTKSATWSSASAFTSITVSNNVDVILIEDNSTVIKIQGKDVLVDAIRLEVIKGELKVSSLKQSVRHKVTVFIPVNRLQQITVRGASKISSQGVLNSPKLKVNIAGDCIVHVTTVGAIFVDSDYDYDYAYNKNKTQRIQVIEREL